MPACDRTCRRASVSFSILLAVLLATSAWAQTQDERCPEGSPPAHNNVAALYCLELGYRVEPAETEHGQSGLCVFTDDSRCPEWDFYAGKCGASFSLCAQRKLEQRNRADGKDTYAQAYTACVENGVEVSVSDMLGFPKRFDTCIGPTGPIITRRTPGSEPPRRGERASGPGRPFAPNPLPSSFTWRSKDGNDWMTSVKDQSQCGSCWAFSAVGATEAVFNIERNNPNFGLDLSEELLNGGSAGSCCGGWHDAALGIIKNSGIPDEQCLPYDVPYYNTGGCDCFGNPPCNASCTGLPAECSNLLPADACGDMATRLTTIANFYSVPNNIDTIKTRLIDEGPLSVCYAHQGQYNGDVYECPWGWCRDAQGNPNGSCSGAGDPVCPGGTTCKPIGMNHCVVLAGYDDNGGNGFWIVKNSWGAGYDGDGYFNLRYNNCLIQNAVFYVDSGTTPNRAPVAEADGPYAAECQGATTALPLDGTGSSDPDADALAYAWTSTCPSPSFNDAGSATPTLSLATSSLAAPLSCSVDLTVTDPGSLADTDSATVTVRDTTPPTIACPPNQLAECTGPQGAVVTYPPPSASDVCSASVTSVCTPPSGGVFAPGTTPVTCTGTDASSNQSACAFQVSVQDTTPPTITGVSARPDVLWPPNHKMVPVAVTVEASDVCGATTCRVVSVASDEPVDGLGDGDTAPDWTITGALTVDLRAERAGGGDGRTYTVNVECKDASGNGATAPVTVTVPHAMGRK